MDLHRSSSNFLASLWSLYVFISLALVLGVSSNLESSSAHGSEPHHPSFGHVKSAAFAPSAKAGGAHPASHGPSSAHAGRAKSAGGGLAGHRPSSLHAGGAKLAAAAPATHEPSSLHAAPADQGSSSPNAAPADQGSPHPNAAPADQGSPHPNPAPADQGSPHPNAAPADQGSPRPNAAPADQGSSPPNAAPADQGGSSSNAVRKPKTPPPPPEEYMKGDPHPMKEFFEQTFGDQRLQFFDNGTTKLSLDQSSGSGFKSKDEYLFITMTIQMKLIPGHSAGSVTTFYLTSSGFGHDEIDIEFLGNATGEPYTLHTNVYVDGKGNREQQFHLWFDPTLDFHTYTLSWTAKRIAWYVDGIPIRQYKSDNANGVPYPSKKPQRIIASLWNADDWATQGGKVKADWSKGPLIAYYKDFTAGFCLWQGGSSSCGITPGPDPKLAWLNEEFDQKGLDKIKWSQENLMVYNYCRDPNRFAEGGIPKECSINP